MRCRAVPNPATANQWIVWIKTSELSQFHEYTVSLAGLLTSSTTKLQACVCWTARLRGRMQAAAYRCIRVIQSQAAAAAAAAAAAQQKQQQHEQHSPSCGPVSSTISIASLANSHHAHVLACQQLQPRQHAVFMASIQRCWRSQPASSLLGGGFGFKVPYYPSLCHRPPFDPVGVR
jgi:hypothetical protein